MFIVNTHNLLTDEKKTYQLNKAINRLGAHENCDLRLTELANCGYDIIVTKDLGTNFRCRQVYHDPNFSGEAFNQIYEYNVKFNIGDHKLSITSIDSDLKIKSDEELDQEGYRLLKKALGQDLVSLPALKVIEPREYIFSFGIDQQIIVGRGDKADLTLAESDVSSVHARFSFDDNSYWVEDLGSTNGTFINGKQVSGKLSFKINDRVQLGASTILTGLYPEQLAEVQSQGISDVAKKSDDATAKSAEQPPKEFQEAVRDRVPTNPINSINLADEEDLIAITQVQQDTQAQKPDLGYDTASDLKEAEAKQANKVVAEDHQIADSEEPRITTPVVKKSTYPALVSTSTLARPAKLVLQQDMPIIIGRDPDSDFWLGAPFVSRKHCQVTYLGNNQVEILDTSSNGTGYSRGTIAAGSGHICYNEPEVLHFGSGLAVAVCFDLESENKFIENDGKVDTFISEKLREQEKEIAQNYQSTDESDPDFRSSSTFKPLRKSESVQIEGRVTGVMDKFSDLRFRSKIVFLILGLVVLFVFIVLIKIILIFL